MIENTDELKKIADGLVKLSERLARPQDRNECIRVAVRHRLRAHLMEQVEQRIAVNQQRVDRNKVPTVF